MLGAQLVRGRGVDDALKGRNTGRNEERFMMCGVVGEIGWRPGVSGVARLVWCWGNSDFEMQGPWFAKRG